MTFASKISSIASDPLRFVGRPSRPCRRCGGAEHFVNRSGGIECVACSVADGGAVAEALQEGRHVRLWSVDGQWDSKPDEWAVGDSGDSGGKSLKAGSLGSRVDGDWSKEIHPAVYRWAELGDEAGDGRSFCFAG